MAILRVYNPLTQSWDPIPYIKGDKGDRGYDVTTVEYEYYSSTSSSEPTGGEWSTIMPGYSVGRYIWVRTKTTNTHGEVYTGTPVLATLFNDVNSAELTRRTYETNRVNAETARDTAEGLRDSAEIARASAELLRVSAETSRGNSEVSRANAEAQRVSAESSRVSVEAQRVANEEQRISNENTRIAAQGRYPIVQNNTWWVWSKEDDDYVDTEVTAVGADGVGIASIELTSTADLVDTYTITFDDGSTTTFDVTNGADGISPTITVTEITGGHEVAVTDAEGTQTFEVMDGEVSEEELTEKLADKADIITSSASGEIVTIADGANNLPVKDLSVSILPVQDLHGQSSPYPAGGGPNLRAGIDLANDIKIKVPSAVIDTTNKTVSFAYDAQQTSGIYFPVYQYKENTRYTFILTILNPTIGRTNLRLYYTDSSYTDLPDITANTKQTIAVVSNANKTVLSFSLRKQGGTTYLYYDECATLEGVHTAADFVPYENICPISGWTGVDVTQKSKNLIGGIDVANRIKNKFGANATIDTTAKTVSYAPTIAQGYHSVLYNLNHASEQIPFPYYYPFKENTQYTFIFKATTTSSANNLHLGVSYTDGTNNGGFKKTQADSNGYIVWTSASNKTVLSFYAGIYTNSTPTVLYYDTVGVFEGVVTLDDFTPYEGNYYPIDWTSSAGTVYGGSLDLTSGVLTVDTEKVVVDGTKINQVDTASTGAKYARVSTLFSLTTGIVTCDSYPVVSSVPSPGAVGARFMSSRIYIYDDRFTDLATAQEILNANNVEFIIRNSTPTTYQLTPTQIETLLGTNNFWSNGNGVVDLGYRCDTKLYIQNLTKPTEDDMVANQNITADSFFMVGNRLFMSSVGIGQGQAIVPETNCYEISLADALNQLNS